MRNSIMFLISILFIGCQPPVENKVDVAPAYVDLVTSKVDKTNDLVKEVSEALTVNTQVLSEIKDLIENPPTSGADAQAEPPSTQSSVLAPEVPTLYVSSVSWCRPCRQLERDVKAGKFHPFKVVFSPDPGWEGGYPVIRWKDPDGQWKYHGTTDAQGRYQSAGYGPQTVAQLKTLLGVQ